MTYHDEFNVGNSDLNGWNHDLGTNNGWGNGEQENYTNSSANANVSTDPTTGIGSLNINAIASGSGSNETYTSARIRSDAIFSQTYGLFEFRAKLPVGQGLWPAIWMMPENSSYGGWPTSGEIDVLESKGQNSGLVQGSLHSGNSYNTEDNQTQTFANSGKEPAGFSTSDWHTYDLEWNAGSGSTPASISYFVDSIKYNTFTGGWVVPGSAPNGDVSAPFDKPFYIILNLAVGGNYGGTPNLADGTYSMNVDYIRAYQAQAAPEPLSLITLAGGALMLLRRRKA